MCFHACCAHCVSKGNGSHFRNQRSLRGEMRDCEMREKNRWRRRCQLCAAGRTVKACAGAVLARRIAARIFSKDLLTRLTLCAKRVAFRHRQALLARQCARHVRQQRHNDHQHKCDHHLNSSATRASVSEQSGAGWVGAMVHRSRKNYQLFQKGR